MKFDKESLGAIPYVLIYGSLFTPIMPVTASILAILIIMDMVKEQREREEINGR